MRLQGGTEGETGGDRMRTTAWGGHPCHPRLPCETMSLHRVEKLGCDAQRMDRHSKRPSLVHRLNRAFSFRSDWQAYSQANLRSRSMKLNTKSPAAGAVVALAILEPRTAPTAPAEAGWRSGTWRYGPYRHPNHGRALAARAI